MKKIILTSTIIFLLTGCFGEVGKGYITKTCTKNENIGQIKILKEINIKSKSDEIINIEIKEKYDTKESADAIKQSKISEQKLYKNIDGITLDIKENEYIYKIDPLVVPNDIKEKFEIKDEQHKQIELYTELGYTCK